MEILRPPRATRQQMTKFHTDEYIDFLSRVTPESAPVSYTHLRAHET